MFTNIYANEYQFCDYCYVEAPTRYITFHQSAGAIIIWFHTKLSANLCRSCIKKHFWEFTLISIFGGILSVPSILANIYFIPANIIRYLKSRDLKPASKDAFKLDLSDNILKKIIPYRNEIFDRMEKQEPLWSIAINIADKVGVRPGHIIVYVKIGYKLAPEELGLLHECIFCGSKNMNTLRATYSRSKNDRLNDGYWERYYCECKDCNRNWNGVSTDEVKQEVYKQALNRGYY